MSKLKDPLKGSVDDKENSSLPYLSRLYCNLYHNKVKECLFMYILIYSITFFNVNIIIVICFVYYNGCNE